jgi:hypothetical protein
MNNSVIVLLFLSPIVIILFASYIPNIFALNTASQISAAQYGPHRYMAYQNFSSSYNATDIFFQESHDNGTTFSHPVDLITFVNDTHLIDPNTNPQVGAFGDDVYVIWQGKYSGGAVNLFYIKSSDGGRTFENATNVSENPAVGVLNSILLVDRITGSVFVSYINADGSVVPCHVHCDD